MKTKPQPRAVQGRRAILAGTCVCYAAAAMLLGASFNHSTEASPFQTSGALPALKSPAPPRMDQCLPALSPKRPFPGPSHAMIGGGQPQAGKAAAVSLLLGVRFALGPKERSRQTSEANGPASLSPKDAPAGRQRDALSVAAYRACVKQRWLQVH